MVLVFSVFRKIDYRWKFIFKGKKLGTVEGKNTNRENISV